MVASFSIRWTATHLQRLLLYFFYFFFNKPKGKQSGTIIGFSEICGLIFQIGKIMPGSSTVCFRRDPFFDDTTYDFYLNDGFAFRLRRLIFGAWLAAKIAATYERVIYIGAERLLIESFDSGAFEFKFMKKKGLTIVCWFTGSDIRSLQKLRELHQGSNSQTWADIVPLVYPDRDTPVFEEQQKRRAVVADSFADLIFNNNRDQASYLMRTDSDTFAITDVAFFSDNLEKFSDSDQVCIKILHAPSNPILKGTPLIRSVIARLASEGYRIEYTEARNLSRSEMQIALSETHIFLNQFYAKIPGHAGFEAMASSCIVLQSAEIPDLDACALAIDPWVQCTTYDIYDQLKKVLDHMKDYIPVAEAGYQLAFSVAHPIAVKAKLEELLDF
jgi:hypothetical protein